MKTTRLTNGSGSKTRRFLERLVAARRSPEPILGDGDRGVPERRARCVAPSSWRARPPMLCPTRTIRSRAGSPCPGSTRFAHSHERFAQPPGRRGNRQARRIEKHPELITRRDHRRILQLVDRLHPGPRARDQAVHEDDRDLARLVRPAHVEAVIQSLLIEAANRTARSIRAWPAVAPASSVASGVVRSQASANSLPPTGWNLGPNESSKVSVAGLFRHSPPDQVRRPAS